MFDGAGCVQQECIVGFSENIFIGHHIEQVATEYVIGPGPNRRQEAMIHQDQAEKERQKYSEKAPKKVASYGQWARDLVFSTSKKKISPDAWKQNHFHRLIVLRALPDDATSNVCLLQLCCMPSLRVGRHQFCVMTDIVYFVTQITLPVQEQVHNDTNKTAEPEADINAEPTPKATKLGPREADDTCGIQCNCGGQSRFVLMCGKCCGGGSADVEGHIEAPVVDTLNKFNAE